MNKINYDVPAERFKAPVRHQESLNLTNEVWDMLNKHTQEINISRPEIVDYLLRKALNLPVLHCKPVLELFYNTYVVPAEGGNK